jgi:DNA-binding transcriptional MerR regulator
MDNVLPAIPPKRYFTIGEVSELCGVKPYVLRYWEQEFTQLKPMKRRGNRRYYQHHEVLLIRRIRSLLYEQGFTISGARNQLVDAASSRGDAALAFEHLQDSDVDALDGIEGFDVGALDADELPRKPAASSQGVSAAALAVSQIHRASTSTMPAGPWSIEQIRDELFSIREDLLK